VNSAASEAPSQAFGAGPAQAADGCALVLRAKQQVNVHEMITAAAFSADGTRAVAGSYRGRLRFYEVEGAEGTSPKFEYVTQLDVKNTSNQKRGKKITGLQVRTSVGVDQPSTREVGSTASC
jgi:hypothetical protein